MVKLNRDDHKSNDRGAKIVKWAGLAILAIGSLFVGSKLHDEKDDSEKQKEEGDDDLIC